jgi:hypothetical protein
MMRRLLVLLFALPTFAPGIASADIPYPPYSTCTVSIVQNPVRTQCIDGFAPDVVRLCPSAQSPVFDSVTFDLTILNALADPDSGVMITAYESSGLLNIATGGSTADTTDGKGKASISVTRASGYGRLGVCADGVLVCEVEVRSPDVSISALPAGCALPTTGTSFVNSNDLTNPSCGFFVKFGAVTVGTNSSWDLDCSNVVNASDLLGTVGKGGVIQHWNHGAPLGSRTTCP